MGTLADVTAEAGAEAAMSDARDEADEASRLKSEFLANMSHEIRTPMNGVIGMTDLLLETDLDARQRDYAQTVRNSGEALLTIINDILDFSKIEAGKLEVEHIDFDLRTVVDESCDLLAGSAEAKGLELIDGHRHRGPRRRHRRPGPGAPGPDQPDRQRHQVHPRRATIVVRVTRGQSPTVPTRSCASRSRTPATASPRQAGHASFSPSSRPTRRRPAGTAVPVSGLAISSQLVALMGGELRRVQPARGGEAPSPSRFASRSETAPAAAGSKTSPLPPPAA